MNGKSQVIFESKVWFLSKHEYKKDNFAIVSKVIPSSDCELKELKISLSLLSYIDKLSSKPYVFFEKKLYSTSKSLKALSL